MTTIGPRAFSALFIAFFLAGCGGQVTPTDSSDSATDSSSDSSTDGTPDVPIGCPRSQPSEGAACSTPDLACDYCSVGGGQFSCSSGAWHALGTLCPPTPGCPAAMPGPGTSGRCAPVGLVCGFGDDPRPLCRPQTTCTASGWTTGVGACPPPPTDKCPATIADAEGNSCGVVGAFCTYGDRTCGCGNCFGGPCGGTPKWACDPKNADPSCPAKMPNLGVACSKEGMKCDYGSCAASNPAGRDCTGGVWLDRAIPCPL